MSTTSLGAGNIRTEDGHEIELDRIVAYVRPEKIPHPYRKFVIMNAEAIVAVTEMGLTPLELRLFFRLVAEMPVGNVGQINQTRSAKVLNTSRESINKALGSLVRRGMLEKQKQDGEILWKISPEYAWKGKTQGLVSEYRAVRAKNLRQQLHAIEGGKV